MANQTPIRDLPGRSLIQAINRLSWRFETIKQDYEDLMEIRKPSLFEQERDHRFKKRGQLYEAERRLHHFLSGYYSYQELIETVAETSVENAGRDAVYSKRGTYNQLNQANEIMGLRIYVQHNDILPLLVRNGTHSKESPRFVLNKSELHIDDGYHKGFSHHYGHISERCLYPFRTVEQHWPEIESLHEDVINEIKDKNEQHLQEYESKLSKLEDIRDEKVIPELHDMLDIPFVNE